MAVCPTVALDEGAGLLCRLFETWKQVPAGVLTLAQWLLGEGESDGGMAVDEASSLDEEDFLFEKGDLNLWAEPVQWVRMLHRHLNCLTQSQKRGLGETDQAQLHQLSVQAEAQALGSKQALKALPPLPQFSCTAEHARLVLRHERATLTLDVLRGLREMSWQAK